LPLRFFGGPFCVLRSKFRPLGNLGSEYGGQLGGEEGGVGALLPSLQDPQLQLLRLALEPGQLPQRRRVKVVDVGCIQDVLDLDNRI
jgi:hypothetical protein